MRQTAGSTGRPVRSGGTDPVSGGHGQDSLPAVGFFTKYATQGSPFDFQTDDDDGEDVLEVNGVGRIGTLRVCR